MAVQENVSLSTHAFDNLVQSSSDCTHSVWKTVISRSSVFAHLISFRETRRAIYPSVRHTTLTGVAAD